MRCGPTSSELLQKGLEFGRDISYVLDVALN